MRTETLIDTNPTPDFSDTIIAIRNDSGIMANESCADLIERAEKEQANHETTEEEIGELRDRKLRQFGKQKYK